MKKITSILATIALGAFLAPVNAQTPTAEPEKPAAAADQAADKANSDEEKAWMAYMTPGEMHKMLAKASGEWVDNLTMWMAPDAEPMKVTGTGTCRMILGDRYLESRHNSMMMGMQFEGVGIMGYDNIKKKFISTWVDNMGTGVMTSEGTYDPKTMTMTMNGMMMDPSIGKEIKVREVTKIIDDNNRLMEMYCTKDGKEFKTMEIRSTRKGS